MSKHKMFFYVLVFIAATACTKKEFTPGVVTPNDLSGNCNCQEDAIEYIKATFNTVSTCFSTVKNSSDIFSNAYYRANFIDHINLRRDNIDKTMNCQVRIINTNLSSIKLPYTLPNTEQGVNQYADIIFVDNNHMWGQVSDFYIANSYKDFTLTITDTTGGYLKGFFGGKVHGTNGEALTIEKGSFNMHVINVNETN